MIALTADFDPSKARSIWTTVSDAAWDVSVRRR
jgi:hypothetical protein